MHIGYDGKRAVQNNTGLGNYSYGTTHATASSQGWNNRPHNIASGSTHGLALR